MIEKTEQKHENVGERRGTGKKGDAGGKEQGGGVTHQYYGSEAK